MNGFNPEIKASADGEAQPRNLEVEERLATPLETRILALSQAERDQLYLDALDKMNEAEQVLHTINRINSKESEDTLF